jgi:hypothetical protein
MVEFGLAAAAVIVPRVGDGIRIPERIGAMAATVVSSALRGEAGDGSALSRCRFQWNLGGNRLAVSRYMVQWLFTPDQEDWASLPVPHRRLLFMLVPWRVLRLMQRAVSGAL